MLHVSAGGKNKTSLDGHFGSQGRRVRATVIKNRGVKDVVDDETLVDAIAEANGAGSHVQKMTPNRAEFKLGGGEVKGIGHMSQRVYEFDAEGKFAGLRIRQQTLLGEGRLVSSVELLGTTTAADIPLPEEHATTSKVLGAKLFITVLSKEQKIEAATAKKDKHDRVEERKKNHQEEAAFSAQEVMKKSSLYFCSDHPGGNQHCTRSFTYLRNMTKHLACGECSGGVLRPWANTTSTRLRDGSSAGASSSSGTNHGQAEEVAPGVGAEHEASSSEASSCEVVESSSSEASSSSDDEASSSDRDGNSSSDEDEGKPARTIFRKAALPRGTLGQRATDMFVASVAQRTESGCCVEGRTAAAAVSGWAGSVALLDGSTKLLLPPLVGAAVFKNVTGERRVDLQFAILEALYMHGSTKTNHFTASKIMEQACTVAGVQVVARDYPKLELFTDAAERGVALLDSRLDVMEPAVIKPYFSKGAGEIPRLRAALKERKRKKEEKNAKKHEHNKVLMVEAQVRFENPRGKPLAKGMMQHILTRALEAQGKSRADIQREVGSKSAAEVKDIWTLHISTGATIPWAALQCPPPVGSGAGDASESEEEGGGGAADEPQQKRACGEVRAAERGPGT